MAGFKNDVVYAKNADFSQSDNLSPSEGNGLATDGQLWTGSTSVNVGGTHVNVGQMTSPNNSITFGYSSPNITAVVNTSVVRDLHTTPYIVGAGGLPDGAAYTTVQAGIDAAEAMGGGIVYIQPGTYIENITMRQGVHLVGWIGTSGNIGLTISGGEDLPVVIQGNFTLDLTTAAATPTVEFHNIQFTVPSGVLFANVGNVVLLESGYITFFNCQFIAGNTTTYIFSVNGFYNISLESCVIDETTPDTTNLFSLGATPFLNLNVRNSWIDINATNALIIPTGSFNTVTIQNSYWAARLDSSTGTQTLNVSANTCQLSSSAAGAGDPLINFGANDGSFTVNNSTILTTSGSLASSTSVSAASIFRFNNCIWLNALTLGANARGEFSYCEFYGGSSAAITMSSAQNISILQSVISSTNNPAIAGAGAGTLTYSDLVFLSNAAFAGTLTLATVSWRPYSVALAATDGTKVGTCNFNSAQFSVDANGFVSTSGTGIGNTITGDSGGALSPTAGNWNIFGRSGSKTSGSGSTLTVNSPPFSQVGASATSVLNSGEFVTAAVTRTLPATAGLLDGDLVIYACTTASALVITANTGQTIRIGTLVSSSAGTATSTAIGDTVTLRFNATAVQWQAVGVIGTWVMA